MNEQAAWDEALRVAPHDLMVRLAYADWLADRGDPREGAVRAVAARLQVEYQVEHRRREEERAEAERQRQEWLRGAPARRKAQEFQERERERTRKANIREELRDFKGRLWCDCWKCQQVWWRTAGQYACWGLCWAVVIGSVGTGGGYLVWENWPAVRDVLLTLLAWACALFFLVGAVGGLIGAGGGK